MKPVYQTKFGNRGNCYAACLASMLEIDLESIPDFFDPDAEDKEEAYITTAWWDRLRAFLRPLGYGVVCIPFKSAGHWQAWSIEGPHVVSGKSPRFNNEYHATVWEHGKLVHDPHPDGDGFAEPEYIDFLYVLDPRTNK